MARSNPMIFLAIVVALGICAVEAIGGIIFADATQRIPSRDLGVLAAACIGAITGFLVNPPTWVRTQQEEPHATGTESKALPPHG